MDLELSTEQLEKFYIDIHRVRDFDLRAMELFEAGFVKGSAHSCVGQEAIPVGACAALTLEDYVVSYHRGHGHCLAKGADMTRMMAELFGKATGYCGGLGGSMHIADLEKGILGANGIVGAGIGLGSGAALSASIKGTSQVCISFFGDGASNEGIFHESLNLAAVWKLPVIFLCENNQYGLSAKMSESTSVDQISKRAAAYDIPGVTIDGNDVVAVYATVAEAVARARAGKGPTLIEAMTYRWDNHSMRANLPQYRSDEEVAAWKAKDPVIVLTERLKERQVGTGRLQSLADMAAKEVEASIDAARAAPEPTLDALLDAVSAPHASSIVEPGVSAAGGREISYPDAIREALDQEMASDPSVFVMGEDVAKIGGIFACTRGLLDKHGPTRVRDTPISENAIASFGVGAAITGLRPVVELQFFDFVTHMMDPIVNQAAKFRFMLGGLPKVPIVFRGPQGAGVRLAAQHSQSLESWFCNVPGLTVIGPSTPYDAKGLLAAAIQDDNPVVFLEHKYLYVRASGPVPEGRYQIPIGKADVKREGRDVTVVATMAMVAPALAAARELAREGIDIEVIDPRTLRPLDMETILKSVKKTNRAVIVHEGYTKWGFGAEIVSSLVEEAFDYLDAPIQRVGMRDTPIPYNDKLERAVIPSQSDIVEACKKVLYA